MSGSELVLLKRPNKIEVNLNVKKTIKDFVKRESKTADLL